MIRLMFSSAGRRVELINCFRKAADELGIDIEIIAIDMNPSWSPACQGADYAYQVPRCTEFDFFPLVLEICQKHRIDLVIPTIDTELLGYSENRKRFQEIGTDIHVSSTEVVKVARNKLLTAQLLHKHGIPAPMTWTCGEILNGAVNPEFPLVLKPIDGSCSNGISVVNSMEQIIGKGLPIGNYVLQTICHGKEFTINSFYDRNGSCVACVPHFRKMVRAGEVCFAETVRVPQFRKIACQLSELFSGLKGCICFQGFQSDTGEVSLFEINARFGGGYPICDRAGGSFARWILQELTGDEPDYHDEWKEGVRMLRYDAAVFVDR